MKRLSRSPSPATMISVIALVVATTGTAIAAIPSSDGTISACYVKTGALRLIDPTQGEQCSSRETPLGWNQRGPQGAPGTPAAKLFAHVTWTGTLSSVHEGATSAQRKAVGDYTVTFNRNLGGCVAIADVGTVAGAGIPGSYYWNSVATTDLHADSNRVDVHVMDPATGDNRDGNFNLAVFCGT